VPWPTPHSSLAASPLARATPCPGNPQPSLVKIQPFASRIEPFLSKRLDATIAREPSTGAKNEGYPAQPFNRSSLQYSRGLAHRRPPDRRLSSGLSRGRYPVDDCTRTEYAPA